MRFSTIMLLASPILAFTIPEGQANGVYSVSYGINGEEIHTLLRAVEGVDVDVSPRSESSLSAKFRLGKRGISCATGADANELNHGDTDRANSELDQQCGSGTSVGAEQDFYSIVGCTVSYFCNFSGDGQTCTSWGRASASAQITRQCGAYHGGWTTEDNNSDSYGYENYCSAVGSRFCGRGR